MSNPRNGKARVDFSQGVGFGPTGGRPGQGLPADFLGGDPAIVLPTIALMYTRPDPMRVNTYGQAMTVLALYAAGAQVEMSVELFGQLTEKVEEYRDIQKDEKHGHEQNVQFAQYVLRYSQHRASSDWLV